MLLPAGGDVGIQPTLLAGLEVGGAAVARIRSEQLGQLAGVGLDSLHHRHEVHGVAGLVADANGHDHLVVTIDGGLDVVALDPAIRRW